PVRLKGEEQVYVPEMRSEGQIELYKMWNVMVEDFEREHVDTLIVDGDCFEGTAPWDGGRSTMLSSIDIQRRMAYNLIQPLAQTVEKVHIFAGTPIHESRDSRTHADLAKDLRGDCSSVEFQGFLRNLELTPTGTVVNVSHKATGAMIYTATVLDRESLFMMAAEAREKLPRFHVIVRAHLHGYLYLDNGYHHIIQLPCWKAWFPFKGAARLFGKMQPDIGYVLLKCYDDGAIEIKRKIWNAPDGFGLDAVSG
ncbi:unnamed protein product, partial [marine sediment metagenome]